MVAIIASLLVSYARARAEGLGHRLQGGAGAAGRADRRARASRRCCSGRGREGLLLFWIVAILALASVITVVQRFVYVYQVTEGAAAPEAPKGP